MACHPSLPPFAEICRIHEVVYAWQSKLMKRVRVIGRLAEKDIHQNTVLLTSPISSSKDHPCHLKVNVRLIYPFEAYTGSLYETIGEVLLSGEEVTLQAHTWRCMDGLDVVMYYRAIEMRRNYFSQRNLKGTPNDTG